MLWNVLQKQQQQTYSRASVEENQRQFELSKKHISAIMINCNTAEINVAKNEMETKADVSAVCVCLSAVCL